MRITALTFSRCCQDGVQQGPSRDYVFRGVKAAILAALQRIFPPDCRLERDKSLIFSLLQIEQFLFCVYICPALGKAGGILQI